MKLILTRNQTIRKIGGVVFELHAKVDLTEDELELVKRYHALGEVLLKKKVVGGEQRITIRKLTKGIFIKSSNINQLQRYEQAVTEGCDNFRNYLESMITYGGSEEIEYQITIVDSNGSQKNKEMDASEEENEQTKED